MRPYRRRILAAALALVVAAGSVLAIGQGLKLVIDRGIAAGNPGMLNEALVGLLAVLAGVTVNGSAAWSSFALNGLVMAGTGPTPSRIILFKNSLEHK